MIIDYDLIIIGAGPAGLTAAIYASRNDLKTLMLEKSAPGGKLVKTNEISNYPGTIHASGTDLAIKMYEHATAYNAEYAYGDIIDIKDNKEYKEVICTDKTYTSKAIIIATGTNERLLNVPNEQKFIGRGISFCAICDAAFYKNKTVTVIGGGNSALEEALYLANIVDKLNLVIRRDVFRANIDIQEKVLNNPKITIYRNYIVKDVIGEDSITGIKLENTKTNEILDLETSGIFPYIGSDPATQFINLDILNDNKYIKVNNNMETSIKGIYAAGDVVDKHIRQVVTATNDGAIAAQSAFHYIKD